MGDIARVGATWRNAVVLHWSGVVYMQRHSNAQVSECTRYIEDFSERVCMRTFFYGEGLFI
jgi:hypothetical protein